MLSPNLNGGTTILWTSLWLQCKQFDWFIIPILSEITNILECSIQRNRESYISSVWVFFLSIKWRSVLTLDTQGSPHVTITFLLVGFWLFSWARNIGTSNCNVSELTFWFWMLLLVLSEWTTSNNDFSVTICGTVRWPDALNFDSLLAIFKEFVILCGGMLSFSWSSCSIC